jgi:hypothetical protein
MLQIRLGNMGLRKAAKHYQIPKSTLSDRVAGKYKMGSKPGRPQKQSHDDEDKLINHAIERAKLGIGFSKQNFLKCAGDLAIKRKHPFKNKSPSDKWWRLHVTGLGVVLVCSPFCTSLLPYQTTLI